MSSQVNYVVVRGGVVRVHALGGGTGLGIDTDFAVGPEVALRRLDGLGERVVVPWFGAADGWFDDVMCEGGVLVDVDRRVLLLFNTVCNGMVYRAAMLEAYAATWPGWEIRWAYDGIGDLMAYAGVDPAAARDDEGPEPTGRNTFGPDDVVAAVVTVRGGDGRVRLYGVHPEAAWGVSGLRSAGGRRGSSRGCGPASCGRSRPAP